MGTDSDDDARGDYDSESDVGQREAWLDLFLAEELAVDPDFVDWFVHQLGGDLPADRPVKRRVGLNVHEKGPELPEDSHGETDVELVVSWGERTVPILIEDKLWAPFQPRQPQRYLARAESRCGRAVLVAPEEYLRGRQQGASFFHARVSIEQVVDYLRCNAAGPGEARRLWRADTLERLAQQPAPVEDHEPTIAFTEFCLAWFDTYDPAVEPRPSSLHTSNNGWLYFWTPKGLIYKVAGWSKKPNAAVDLMLRDHGFNGSLEEAEALVAQVGLPDGFHVSVDTARPPNLILSYTCEKVVPAGGAPKPGSDEEAAVIDALRACSAISHWLTEHLGRPEGRDG